MKIQGVKLQGTKLVPSGDVVNSDTYFNLVSLLLPGNGTNGAQNNTFVDSSVNAATVTRNGNPTQGTFSPFSQTGWSNYFNGSTDYVQIGSNQSSISWLNTAGSTGTIEAWIMPMSFRAGNQVYTHPCVLGNGGTYFNFGLANGVPRLYWWTGAGNTLDASSAVTLGAWTHLAVVFNGSGANNLKMYVNGTLAATGTFTNINWASGSGGNNVYIGGEESNFPTSAWPGYISNLRITNGTALYTSNFTPSTSALAAVSGTTVMTCQNNRFVDNSASPYTLSPAASTSVQAFSPFDPTAAYSTTTVGGSAYFDGSGDYLSLASNSQTAVASNAFTLECYVYFASPAEDSNQPLYTNYTTFSTAGSIYVGKHTNYSGRMTVWISNYSTAGPLLLESTVPPAGWTHYALVRSGNTFTLYRNGAVSVSATFAGATTGATNASYIAAGIEAGGIQLEGYLSSFRIVNGTAVYTSAFTPPTAPVTAISNTALLLNYTNAGIADVTSKNILETVSTAQISTAQSKFGGSAMLFNGSSDYLNLNAQVMLSFGTGDFTIEAWMYPTSVPSLYAALIEARSGANFNPWACGLRTSGGVLKPDMFTGTQYTGSTTVPLNTWTHFAVSRASSTLRIFVNGTLDTSWSSVTAIVNAQTTAQFIGRLRDGANSYFPGYINDLRVTKGLARYTANFTPPTTAFPTQ